MQHGDAPVVVEADVGVLVAAVGVRDRGKDEVQHIPVQTGQDRAEVDGLAARQRGDDPQHPLLAARERDQVVDRKSVV